MLQLTAPRTENFRYVSFTTLIAFSFSIALQNDDASKWSELQSIPTPLNKISMTGAVRNGVFGSKICVNALMAMSSNGALSL